MSVLLLDRQTVHYEVLGRGRPLIFLHGWIGSWRYWLSAMQAASISFRSYALDMWGFGDSMKNMRYSLEQQVQLLEDFFAQMGIGKVAFVGHGWGSIVALRYSQLHPEMVDRVMAVGMPLAETMINPKLRSKASPLELADWLLGKALVTDPVRTEAAKTDPQAVQISFASLGGDILSSLGNQPNLAVLLVYGQNDPAITPPAVEMAVALPQKTHVVFLDQSGYFPMLDESAKFNRLLIDFLALPSGESPRDLQFKEEWKRRVR